MDMLVVLIIVVVVPLLMVRMEKKHRQRRLDDAVGRERSREPKIETDAPRGVSPDALVSGVFGCVGVAIGSLMTYHFGVQTMADQAYTDQATGTYADLVSAEMRQRFSASSADIRNRVSIHARAAVYGDSSTIAALAKSVEPLPGTAPVEPDPDLIQLVLAMRRELSGTGVNKEDLKRLLVRIQSGN